MWNSGIVKELTDIPLFLSLGKIGLFLLVQFVIFAPIESLYSVRSIRPDKRLGAMLDAIHFVINSWLVQGPAIAIVTIAAFVSFAVVPLEVRRGFALQPNGVQFLELVFLSDFFAYLAHRALHQIPFLWKFHRVHHSSQELDWLATHRQHPMDVAVLLLAENLPVYLLADSLAPFVYFQIFQKLHTVFVHSNLKMSLGWLENLIATPSFHHWHHARLNAQAGSNFGSLFTFYDRWFKTGAITSPGVYPESYGLEGVPLRANYVGHVFLLRPRSNQELVIPSDDAPAGGEGPKDQSAA